MKRMCLMFFIALIWGNMNFIAAQQRAMGDDGIYYLKTGDGHEEQTVDGTLTFKCTQSATIPGYRDTGVTFAPARPGELIRIQVEEIDLDGTNNYLLLYQGYVRTGYSGASDGVGQSKYMPAGWFEKIGSTAAGKIYESDAADGKLSIGFHSGSANGQKGFTITVSSVSMTDMAFVSAGAFLENPSLNRGGRKQILAGVNVKTDGGNAPLALTGLSFNTSELSGSDMENIRIYTGNRFTEADQLAIAAAPSSRISITEEFVLKPGNNYFYLVADIKPDARQGKALAVSLASVKVDGEEKTIDPASPATAASVSNTILMATEHQTYTISANNHFYDDGGKNASITQGFEGSLTFVPADENKKISIAFSELNLFNTSSVGMNDIFEFYNGKTVDASQRIATLLNEPEIVKSSAADGSMTVYLKSTAGMPKGGWEALVSQFLPGPMSYERVEFAPTPTANLAAGDSNQVILLFSVLTSNSNSPLLIDELSFDATGTSQLTSIANAKVYYLGKKNTFSTSQLFGSAEVTNNSFSITGSQALIEGNNYFALVYDVAATALNEEELAASLKSISLAGNKHTLNGETGKRSVKNIFQAIAGTHSRSIYGDWLYTHQPSPVRPDLYDYTRDNRIVTFLPGANDGSTVEIDFTYFDVYWGPSAMYTRATFEIYSGTEIDEANLLWKLDSEEQKKTGPGRKLRSLAANGALTIRFNANEEYFSTGAATGWKANISLFKNHDMEVKQLTVFQNNTSNLNPGATNQEIIRIGMETEGTLSTLNVTGFIVDLKESAPSIDKVNVLYSAGENDFSKAVPFGSVSATTGNEVHISGTQALPEGKVWFWISYDISSMAESDIVVDAALKTIQIEGMEALTPTDGDPEGERTVKNEVFLQAGNNGEVVVGSQLLFYDDGGVEENYSRNFNGQITFVPANEGDIVRIIFDDFDVSGSHPLTIYDGKEVDESKLRAVLSNAGSKVIPDGLFSTSADGALTITFTSTSTGGYKGWVARISSGQPEELYIQEVATTQVEDSAIVRGSANVAVQRIAVKVAGDYDYSTLTLNNLKFTTGATTATGDILHANLFYTGKSTAFMDDCPVSTTQTTAPYIFSTTEGVIIHKPGTYYFWLAYTIDPEANPGNTLNAVMTGLTANDESHEAIVEESSVNRTIKAGFKGTYTIGASDEADYTTFESAIADLSEGVEGAVRFEIEDGSYAENIRIASVKGTSEKHPIVFTSQSGNSSKVILTGKPTYEAGINGVLIVENTSYVTFEDLTFKPSSQSYPNIIYVADASRRFTLRNSVLEAGLVYTGYNGMNLVRAEAGSGEGRNNDYITIENNTLTGGYIGLYLGGTGTVAFTKERGAKVRNNTLINQCSKSIYMRDEENTLIEGNVISSASVEKNGYWAMDIYRNKKNVIIRNNRINNSQAYESNGIYLRELAGISLEQPALVYNNVINISNSPSASTNGIYMTSECENIAFYYNTVNVSNGNGRILGTTGSAATKNIIIQNNLFQNTTPGLVYFIMANAQTDSWSFINNAYYFTGETMTNNRGEDWESWLSISGETGSIIEQAQFVTVNDLHLMEPGELQIASPVPFIPADADGKLRHGITPTVGAYEYSEIEIIEPEIVEGYPKTGDITFESLVVKSKWNQSGKLYSLIRTSEEGKPTIEDLLESTPADIENGIEKNTGFSGLEEEKSYVVYLLMESASGLKSAIIESETITTLKQIFPLEIELAREQERINAGDEVRVSAVITGGVAPYTIVWKNEKNEILSQNADLTIRPQLTATYTVHITDARDEKLIARTSIPVTGQSAVATFDDLYLEEESYWSGYPEEETSTLYSGSYSFSNYYIPDWNYWSGTAYSNVTATGFDPQQFVSHQFRAVTGQGVNSANYGIFYDAGTIIRPSNTTGAALIPGTYITNNAWTYYAMMNGDGMTEEGFAQGDYFKIIFKGTHADNSTETVEYFLADYTSDKAEEHYIVTDWQWVDLSPLGEVTKVVISFASSRTNNYGITTPVYACFDNFGASAPVVEPEYYTIVLTASEGGSVSGEGRYEENTSVTVTATANENFEFVNWTEGEQVVSTEASYTFVLTADRNLKANFQTIVSIQEINPDETWIYLADQTLFVKTDLQEYTLRIYSTDGSLVYKQAARGNVEINVSSWTDRVYIIELLSAQGKQVKKIMK